MELSCDESVLAGCDENARAAYGEVMLDIIRRCRRNRGALTTHFNPKKNAVKARFTNILYGSGKKRGLWLIVVCLVLCLIAGTIVACRTEGEEADETAEEVQQNETLLDAYDLYQTEYNDLQAQMKLLDNKYADLTASRAEMETELQSLTASRENLHTQLAEMPEDTEEALHLRFIIQEYDEAIKSRQLAIAGIDSEITLLESQRQTIQEKLQSLAAIMNDTEAKMQEMETLPDTGKENGQYSSMESYVTDRMAQETTAQYFASEPDGSFSNQQKTANVTDTKLLRLEKKGELAGLAPEGILECWEYKYLLQLDVPTEEIMIVGGQQEEDGWFDLEGQGNHTTVALRYPDGTYTVLRDDVVADGIDFTGYRNSYEEAIHDWYVTEYGLDLPLYVQDWINEIILPEKDIMGNQPVHRFDGEGWGIYIPVSAWYQSTDAMENQWLWRSSYNTGSTLTVDVFSHALEDEYITAEKQGYTPADSTNRVWENHTDGLHSCYYYYENPNGGFWRVTIAWTDEGVTNDNANIVIEPQLLKLMAEKFVVFAKGTDTVSVTSAIYLCDDVYRDENTPTHGESTIVFPAGLGEYALKSCEVLLCDDGCDPTDVVSRAFWGYGPAWRIDRYEEYATADGWSYPTRRYINEVPEDIREQMRQQGAPDSVLYPREYLYLVTLPDNRYAYICVEPSDVDSVKPENEEALVNTLVASVQIGLTLPEADTMRMSYLDTHMEYPARWYNEQIGALGTAGGDNLPEADFMFWLNEWRAYEESETGRVWTLEAVPLADFDETAEFFMETEGIDVYASGFSYNSYVLGTDTKYVYVLTLPTDVQYLENDPVSQANYKLLQAGSQAVLENFMAVNGITPNPACPATVVYSTGSAAAEVIEIPEPLASVLLSIDTDAPLVRLSMTLHQAETDMRLVKGAENGWGFNGDSSAIARLQGYTYTTVESYEIPEGRWQINMMPAGEEDWLLYTWEGSDLLCLEMDHNKYVYRAPDSGEHGAIYELGDIVRNWYDHAEYAAGTANADTVIPDTGQTWLEAAKAWCEQNIEPYFQVSDGSMYKWSYGICQVEEDGSRKFLLEKGWLEEGAWPFELTEIFVPENPRAEQYFMPGNTAPYAGEDPAVPEGAYQRIVRGYVILREDGWHGKIVGTAW